MNKLDMIYSSYSDAMANQNKWKEGQIVNITDKALPIPADKVGGADSIDKNKLIIVNANGEYQFITIAELKALLGIV